MSRIEMIEIGKLLADPLNVRKSGKDDGIDQLAANIVAVGLKQSLLVRPADKAGFWFVTAGGRRRQALAKLVKDGSRKATDTVPCIIEEGSTEGHAIEASLVENVHRVNMSPIDEFEAFDKLHSEGATVADIAQRFAMPERRVKQRLALAGLHGDVLKALKDGHINFDTAQAFTLAASKKEQAEVLRQFVESQKRYPNEWMVRQKFTDKDLREDTDLAEMLGGREAYLAAGGQVIEDLFGDLVYWKSRDVIEKLKAEAFARLVDQYKAEGWAFVNRIHDYKDFWSLNQEYPKEREFTEEEANRLSELEAIMEDESASQQDRDQAEAEYNRLSNVTKEYTAEQKAASGVVICLDTGQIYLGRIDPKSAKPRKAAHQQAEGKKEERDPMAISAALQGRLSVAQRMALSDHLTAEGGEQQALALIVAMLEGSLVGDSTPSIFLTDFRQRQRDDDGLPMIKAQAFDKRLAGALKADTGELLKRLAVIAARSCNISDMWCAYGEMQANRDVVVKAMQPDTLARFDAADYIASVGKPVLLALLADIEGKKAAKANADAKKADLAKLALEAVQTDEGRRWLPPQLRSKSYEGPKA